MNQKCISLSVPMRLEGRWFHVYIYIYLYTCKYIHVCVCYMHAYLLQTFYACLLRASEARAVFFIPETMRVIIMNQKMRAFLN